MNHVTVITLDKRVIQSNTDPEIETITARMNKAMLDATLTALYSVTSPEGNDAFEEAHDAYFELTGNMWEQFK